MSAWRENIERVRNAHHHAHMMLHFGLSGCPVCAALDALTAQIEELERDRDADILQSGIEDGWATRLKTRAEAAEQERDHAKIEVGRESELRNDAEQRVKELERALRSALDDLIWMSGSEDFGPSGKALEGFRKVRDRTDGYFAALAQSDPPEDAG